uniref:Glutamine amidotransferase domain-containing protein n=1 Tax=Salix viminalis TaxID=40686 RepID=A0A6N2LIV4_SALVM
MGGKRFAVLLCAEDSEYVTKMYGGYFGVFVRMLAEEGEAWSVYRVVSGEFPEDDEIDTFDGFVITGSCNDAHSNDILCRALGGKTGRATSGWDIGIKTINFSASWRLSSSVKTPAALSVIECHRDEVKELPPRAEVIAWSDKTGIEMFRCGDHAMGIQGHPEYTKDILLHLINRLLRCNFITDSYAEEIKANLEGTEPDREAWKKLCINFLKG